MIQIVLIILVLLMIYDMWSVYKRYNKYEYFTADEAVANIASLYNNKNLVVTDLNSTGTGTFNTVRANNVAATTTNTSALTATNASVNGKLTIGTLGSDDVFIGRFAQANCGNPKPSGSSYGTQSSIFNSTDKCTQICPPGSVMVGILNGDEFDHKHPLCRWINK